MQRNIFEKNKITDLQQGCLFWGANSDGYDKPIWGLIITPRCDIAQNKVKTVHYLPITKFTDWKDTYLVAMFQAEEIKKKYNVLSPIFDSKSISRSLLDVKYKLSDQDLEAMFAGKSMPGDFCVNLREYWSYHDLDYCRKKLPSWKNYDNRLKELMSGNMERFLLLEHWSDDSEQFYVIHLTEVRHLQITTARALIQGVRANMISEEKDDLFFDNRPVAREYRIITQLTSPYLEYVCQKFANAFFRIGIQDWPQSDLCTKLKKI